jgi:hypothetical protein
MDYLLAMRGAARANQNGRLSNLKIMRAHTHAARAARLMQKVHRLVNNIMICLESNYMEHNQSKSISAKTI